MAYEIDFIGVGTDKCTQDADAICLRWKCGSDIFGLPKYKIGVIDGGFEAHGDAMVEHMNRYYFNDANGKLGKDKKIIDFMVVTHPDQDHTSGLKKILQNFKVKKIYMNRPWCYVDELFDKVNDGRRTPDGIKWELHEKYHTISEIEGIAQDEGIEISCAFNDTLCIEDSLLILSPSKQFYLDLLVESEKTPFQENSQKQGLFSRAKEYLLNIAEDWGYETLRDDVSTSSENESSVVLFGYEGFLLTGDAGIRALNNAIDYAESKDIDIPASVSFYQIPHHGGRHNVGPSVLDRMLGKKVSNGCSKGKTACASVADGSDHPLKMVTNAYIRRGVTPYKTNGNTIRHHEGDMPDRGWPRAESIGFADKVEKWDD